MFLITGSWLGREAFKSIDTEPLLIKTIFKEGLEKLEVPEEIEQLPFELKILNKFNEDELQFEGLMSEVLGIVEVVEVGIVNFIGKTNKVEVGEGILYFLENELLEASSIKYR